MMNNRSMPSSTVIPVLPYPDIVAAIDWLTGAFGFSLRLQIATHRAQLNAGDGAVVLTHNPAFKETSPVGYSVMVRVADVDAHHNRAIQYQARILAPPCDHPYGERQYTVADLAGHIWTFSESVADVDPRDWGGTPGAL
jgi:uncharacterized glyoxalase superfamily protein PhnB